jgi:hypothetical protein
MDINCFAEEIDNKALLPKGFQRSDIVQPIWYRSTMLHDLPEKFLLGKGGGEGIMNGFDSDSNLSGHLQQIEADAHPLAGGFHLGIKILRTRPGVGLVRERTHEGFTVL